MDNNNYLPYVGLGVGTLGLGAAGALGWKLHKALKNVSKLSNDVRIKNNKIES